MRPATAENKKAAAKFIDSVAAYGGEGTDPVGALGRCQKVLAKAGRDAPGKVVFLLTDGAFRNNDDVYRCIRRCFHDVQFCTFLVGGDLDDTIIKMMKDAAARTGGQYKEIGDE